MSICGAQLLNNRKLHVPNDCELTGAEFKGLDVDEELGGELAGVVVAEFSGAEVTIVVGFDVTFLDDFIVAAGVGDAAVLVTGAGLVAGVGSFLTPVFESSVAICLSARDANTSRRAPICCLYK